MAEALIDANVFLRHVADDHAQHSPRASAFFARIERGELRGRTSETVIFEAVFTLERTYRESKSAIRDAVVPLIDLPGLILTGKERLRRTFHIYVEQNMSFADAHHVALMEQLGITEIVSFDRDFDRVPGITRVEPS